MDLKQNNLLKTGIIGSAIAALCCFTPILTVVLGGLGLSAMGGYLDLVLLPVLALFIGLLIFAIWQRLKT